MGGTLQEQDFEGNSLFFWATKHRLTSCEPTNVSFRLPCSQWNTILYIYYIVAYKPNNDNDKNGNNTAVVIVCNSNNHNDQIIGSCCSFNVRCNTQYIRYVRSRTLSKISILSCSNLRPLDFSELWVIPTTRLMRSVWNHLKRPQNRQALRPLWWMRMNVLNRWDDIPFLSWLSICLATRLDMCHVAVERTIWESCLNSLVRCAKWRPCQSLWLPKWWCSKWKSFTSFPFTNINNSIQGDTITNKTTEIF